MSAIDSRLLDCDTLAEITENFNRALGLIDTQSEALGVEIIRTDGAYAELYISANASAISVPTGETYTKLSLSSSVQGNVNGFVVDVTDGNVTAEKQGIYAIAATFSSKLATTDVVWDTAIFKNNVEIPSLHMRRRFSTSGYTFNVCLTGLVSLNENDVLDVRVKHNNASDVNITTEYANVSLHRICSVAE